MQLAALAYAGAVLSHETAGQCWRLSRPAPVIHVTVPYGRTVCGQSSLAALGLVADALRTRLLSVLPHDVAPRV
jgi:hypothetical protein